VHVNSLFAFGLDPSANNTTARKHQRVRAVIIDDGQRDVMAEGCG
jgi:hypothetical protein